MRDRAYPNRLSSGRFRAASGGLTGKPWSWSGAGRRVPGMAPAGAAGFEVIARKKESGWFHLELRKAG